METTIEQRRAIRAAADAEAHVTVVVVEGDAAPTVTGESPHYETRGGRRVRHPNAYARSGWSNLVYVPSSLCVRVGREWVREHASCRVLRERELGIAA